MYHIINSMTVPYVRRVSLSQVCLLISVLLAAGTCFGQAPLPKPVPPPNPTRQISANPLSAAVPNGFSVAAVGDLIIARAPPQDRDSGFLGVEKLLQKASVTFGNMEGSLLDPRTPGLWPAALNGGDDINGPPSLAKDIKEMGFDLLSQANNHTTDWGIQGMEDTEHALDNAGIVHAGAGANLALAREARYLTTPWGLVALVAMTSSFTGMEPAGMPLRGVAGRPGVSALRTSVCHVVTESQMASLRTIFDNQLDKPEHPADPNAKQLSLFRVHYCIGNNPDLIYTMNPDDLDGILRNIREGKEASNFELVYIHAHQPGNWSDQPPSFMQILAHDAINAGADEFVTSGPHRLRGIEIYKHKPIFYGLGNFFFEVAQLRALDPDTMMRRHLDTGATTDWEYQEVQLSALHFDNPIWYESVVAVSTFDSKGDVQEVKLYPIVLGYRRTPRTDIGVPWLAPPTMAQQILQRLQRLSQPYGTQINIENNVGIIRVRAPS